MLALEALVSLRGPFRADKGPYLADRGPFCLKRPFVGLIRLMVDLRGTALHRISGRSTDGVFREYPETFEVYVETAFQGTEGRCYRYIRHKPKVARATAAEKERII